MIDQNEFERLYTSGEKIYYEDLQLDNMEELGSYFVEKEEVIAFAKQWDPQPFHIDEEAAKQSIFGCLTGSSVHMKAVMTKVISYNMGRLAAVANLSTCFDMPSPMRVGDTLSFVSGVTEKRLSKSRPGIGIARFEAVARNQEGSVVMNHNALAMVECRPST